MTNFQNYHQSSPKCNLRLNGSIEACNIALFLIVGKCGIRFDSNLACLPLVFMNIQIFLMQKIYFTIIIVFGNYFPKLK